MVATARKWRAADLARLPDDGNKYEIVDGVLYVTPPPMGGHEGVRAGFLELLFPYVRAHGLGRIATEPYVGKAKGDRVIPDITLFPLAGPLPDDWNEAPNPTLVVECLSRSTAWRDRVIKKKLYRRLGIANYWIVDRWERTVTVVRPGTDDETLSDRLTWQPPGAAEPLVIDLPALFTEALGRAPVCQPAKLRHAIHPSPDHRSRRSRRGS